MVRKPALLLIAFLAACGGSADTLDRTAQVATPAESGSGDTAAAGSGTVPERAGGPTGTDANAPDREAGATVRGNVVFLGTSLTAGYGVGEDQAYPAVIQARLDSAGLPFRVINAGVSGETSAGGLARLDWVLRNTVDVMVIELGANDGLRGLPVDQLRANLDSIVVRTRRAYPSADIVLAGMEAPPNLGDAYTAEFRQTFSDLARQREAALVPFLLQDVAAVPGLNQSDGIHPTAEGHRILAANVWVVLEPVLRASPVVR